MIGVQTRREWRKLYEQSRLDALFSMEHKLVVYMYILTILEKLSICKNVSNEISLSEKKGYF